MNSAKLEKEEINISKYVDVLGRDFINDARQPIYDGVIDIGSYLKSSPRIVWMLKEPYDGEECTGGGWSLADNIKESIRNQKTTCNSFKMMAKIAYAVQNHIESYEDCIFPGENYDVFRALNSIAIIDISKMPAKTVSGDVNKYYEYWKPILYWQLHVYNPDVVIFGHTYKYFEEDLALVGLKKRYGKNTDYIINNRLYIDAYHPGRKGEEYFSEIVNVIKENA